MDKSFVMSLGLSAAAVIGSIVILGIMITDVYCWSRRRALRRVFGRLDPTHAGERVRATTCAICGHALAYNPHTGTLVQPCRCNLPPLDLTMLIHENAELRDEIKEQIKHAQQWCAEQEKKS